MSKLYFYKTYIWRHESTRASWAILWNKKVNTLVLARCSCIFYWWFMSIIGSCFMFMYMLTFWNCFEHVPLQWHVPLQETRAARALLSVPVYGRHLWFWKQAEYFLEAWVDVTPNRMKRGGGGILSSGLVFHEAKNVYFLDLVLMAQWSICFWACRWSLAGSQPIDN